MPSRTWSQTWVSVYRFSSFSFIHKHATVFFSSLISFDIALCRIDMYYFFLIVCGFKGESI